MASASSDSVPVDDIKYLLTCSMCTETLNEPRSLPCLHNFCKVCLGKYVEPLRGADKNTETFPCPTCRSKFTLKSNQDVADLSSSYFIKNMLEIVAIQQKVKASTACSHCQDPAINHCTQCELFLCKKCSGWHDMWPSHKNHNVLSIEELSNPKSEVKLRSKLYCIKHKDKVLEVYCETCQELCCMLCLLLNHQKEFNHSCVTVSEVTQKQREALQSSCATLDEKLSEGKEALNNICEVIKSLEKNAKTAKDQIKEQKENILKILAEKIDEKAEKMYGDVDKIYDELHSQLSKQHDEIKDYLDKVQASVSLPKNLLTRGSIEEILSSQKLIDEKIKKLRKEQPENLAAVNDGGIQYVPDDIANIKVDEVVGKLGHVGDLGHEFEKTCDEDGSERVATQSQESVPDKLDSVPERDESTLVFQFGSKEAPTLSFADLVQHTSRFVKTSEGKGKGFLGRDEQLLSSNLEDDAEVKVKRLPDIIEPKTGEENEAVLYIHRAKLYRYDLDTEQWKERGVGDIKLLRHNKTKRSRIVMRRAQTYKLCANHYITPGMELKEIARSDHSWMWSVGADFADGVAKNELLAVRFKDRKDAVMFRDRFIECQENNETKEDEAKY